MLSREDDETLVDRLLTLFLIAETEKSGWPIQGQVKLLKMIYLAEERMNKDKTKGFNYSFYRWKHGPMSNDVLNDYRWLSKNGLIETSQYRISVTNRALGLLHDCAPLLNQNKDVLEYIMKIIREFGPYTGKTIKRAVYDLPVLSERKLVSRIELGQELLYKILKNEARKRFRIDEDWVETLAVLMDKDLLDSLERSLKDAKEGRIKGYKPMEETT